MNKDYIFVIWASVIMFLLIGVFGVGLYEEKNKDRLTVERTFVDAAKYYIDNNNIKIETSLVVPYEDLKKYDYVDEVKYKDKTCTSDVIVERKFSFFKTYKTKVICK